VTAKKPIVVRNWRVVEASPSGLFVWFDPSRESVEVYELMEPLKNEGVADALERDDPDVKNGPVQLKMRISDPGDRSVF